MGKIFTTSFEDIAEFTSRGYYIEGGSSYDSGQALTPENKVDGLVSNKAWPLFARALDNDGEGILYKPHRAYPTVQMFKDSGGTGTFVGPCLLSMYVHLDMTLKDRTGIDDWLSLVTLCCDPSVNWSRTVLCNLTTDGYLRLVHVPTQGLQVHTYQMNSSIDVNRIYRCPQKTWFRLDMYCDFTVTTGKAIIWQDGIRVSEAPVTDGNGTLAQVHCGLYCAAMVDHGYVYNDKLRIMEVANQAEAESLLGVDYVV